MNPMKHSARLVMMMLAALAVGATACGPDVPANPDWATDVRPIIQARCVRCHDPMMRVDPAVKDLGPTIPLNADAATPLGASLFTTMILPRVRGGDASMRVMPPPPNARLEGWQIDIFANYAKTHTP